VVEPIEEHYKYYYLFKNGKKSSDNSIYYYDNTPDCKSEESVRFLQNNKMGMYNTQGEIIIPPIYSFLSTKKANHIVALKDAQQVCHNGTIYSKQNRCEHPRHKGGTTYLLNESHEILVKNFKYKNSLNWYSMHITDTKENNPLRVYFKGIHGKFYSFIDFKKEFEKWLYTDFLSVLKPHDLQKHLFQEITFVSKEKNAWIHQDKKIFLEKNSKVLISELSKVINKTVKYDILEGSISLFNHKDKAYSKYFDYCAQYKKDKFPMFTLVLDHYKKDGTYDYQDSFDFIKTDEGYKFINITLRKIELQE